VHVLINALATTNLSGRQVLYHHLRHCLLRTPDTVRFTLLHHRGNQDLLASLPGTHRCAGLRAPAWTQQWPGRVLYERTVLPRLVRAQAVDRYLSLSGGWTPRLQCPQYTLALNPWALADIGPRSVPGKIKARLQRHTYRQAVQHAAGIGYGSIYMQRLYRAHAQRCEQKGAIVYPALPDEELADMDALLAQQPPREPNTVLCVSLMAPHKDIETLLKAVHLVRAGGVPARLRLVGGWPDARYRQRIEAEAARLALADAVRIEGHLPRAALLHAYATSTVYALLSRSESFGIPAVEAQRLGTPVVAAQACAAPEICGAGGRYVAAGDAAAAAREIAGLLTNRDAWQRVSDAAIANAHRFEYARTTPELIRLLDLPQQP
jgi:glycosyltransferase involved in cell wall biosynthesis